MMSALIGDALRIGAWIPQPLPVFASGEVVGVVLGDGRGRASYRSCDLEDLRASGFPDYATLDAAMKNGQRSDVYWFKDQTGDTSTDSWGDHWPLAGIPPAGDYSGTTLNARLFDNTVKGGFYADQRTPGAGQTRHLMGWEHATLTAAVCSWYGIIYDRVGAYDAQIVSSVPSTFINTTPFSRYISSGQSGLLLMPTIANTTGLDNTAATVTAITATDQIGNTGVSLLPSWTVSLNQNGPGIATTKPARIAFPFDVTEGRPVTPFFPLPAGVSGVRKMEGLTCSAIYTATNTISLVLVKPVGFIWGHYSQVVHALDLPRTMFALTRIMSNACLNIVSLMGAGNASTKMGYLKTAFA
jgi:hypothetical protein